MQAPKRSKIWGVLALTAALVLGASACSTGSGSKTSAGGGEGGGLPAVVAPDKAIDLVTKSLKGKRVQMVLNTDKVALTASWLRRAEMSFAENGVEFSHTSADWDFQVAAQQLQTAIESKPDAIIVQNADASASASLIQRAQKEGIYVIVVNLGSNAQSDAFIGPNWRLMADKLSTRAAADCKAKSKTDVAVITGLGSDTGTLLFESGAKAAFKREGMNIVATQPAQYDANQANTITRTLLQQNPELCAVVGNWDGMMIGAAKAVGDAGRSGEVGVYTTDSSDIVCDAIGDGIMTAAVNYGAGTTMGDNLSAITLYLLQSGLKAGTARTALFTPTTIIDKSNYKDPSSCYSTPN